MVTDASSSQDLTVRGELIERAYGNYIENRYLVNRRYQRKLVWTLNEKVAFIDSILHGYPIPIILLAENKARGRNVFEQGGVARQVRRGLSGKWCNMTMTENNWTAELERKAAVECGLAVVVNMRQGRDVALSAWAKQNGRFVRIDRKSAWGNPFVIGKDGTRQQVIAAYHNRLLCTPSLLGRLDGLHGKVLGCWCHPLACHGDVLADMVNVNRDEA